MMVVRDGQELRLTVTPRVETQKDPFGNSFTQPVIGLVANDASSDFRVEELSALQAVQFGVSQTWFITERTVNFMVELVQGKQDASQIGGPIRIAEMSGQVSTLGFAALLNMAAVLSVSIGILNLLPIPMLDGGHLLFYAYEAVRGRPLSERMQEIAFRIGFVLVMALMIFAFWNDTLGRA
jgi:regulator of sigma E protease